MNKTLIAALVAAAITIPLSAQAGEVGHREARQEHRIYEGVQGGTISQREYGHLQSQEDRLNAMRERDLHSGDGISPREYARLNRDEDHLSREIHHARHDGHR